MNLKEAYTILELPQTATPEEAKKRYRELTKKYHPDINKESGAEDKFKKINEAYQCVSTGQGTDKQTYANVSNNTGNPFNRQRVVRLENVELHQTISFEESVFGCSKNFTYTRKSKCQSCNGEGQVKLNNGCVKCGGRGMIVSQQGNVIMTQTCQQCYGRMPTKPCETCSTQGSVDSTASVDVTIPGGTLDGRVFRLQGMGHFVGGFMGLEQYTDAFLYVNVTLMQGLSINNGNVVSELKVSLLEALQGCKKSVRTLAGEKEITINPLSKNNDEVAISKLGVNRQGDHVVTIKVEYPKNTEKLIAALLSEEN
jgi:molecular chaperone DnaJ